MKDLRRRFRKKVQQNKGFTLTETLLAVLLLAITFSVIGGGVIMIKNAYQKITLQAEAQTLLSTAISATSADLRSATDISQRADGTWQFQGNTDAHAYGMYYKNDATEGILVCSQASGISVPLLTGKTSTSGLVAQLDGLTYDTAGQYFTVTVKVLYNGSQMESQELVIRPLQ